MFATPRIGPCVTNDRAGPVYHNNRIIVRKLMPSHFAEIELARPAAAVETGKSNFGPIENTRCGKNARIRAARPDGR